MGQEDRDWFREDHARKNGMIYDKRTGKYFPAPKPSASTRFTFNRRSDAPRRPFPAAMFWLGFALLSYAAYKVFRFIF